MAQTYASVSWLDDPKKAEDVDRDERFMSMTKARGDISRGVVKRTNQGKRSQAWGGALRRMTSTDLGPSREDESKFVSVPGRYVPIGFARYAPPVIDPLDYEMYRVAGWRVAVPRTLPGMRVRDLLYRCFYFGPQSAGYVRVGDCLVPAALNIGDRMTLAQAATQFEPFPLTQ
jgi:hypothetical protein